MSAVKLSQMIVLPESQSGKVTLDRLLAGAETPGDRYWASPDQVFIDAGITLDPYQQAAAAIQQGDMSLCWSRQTGKSKTVGGLVVREACRKPNSLCLMLAPSLRQAGEVFRNYVVSLWHDLGRPCGGEATQLELRLGNGSRVVALPQKEATVRCFAGVSLLVIDEASRVVDSLYRAARPMLAVSKGRMIAASTPFGQRGWFYEKCWESGGDWNRIKTKVTACPRIDASFLRRELLELGQQWFDQEYMCSFEAVFGALFQRDDVLAAFESGDELKTLLEMAS